MVLVEAEVRGLLNNMWISNLYVLAMCCDVNPTFGQKYYFFFSFTPVLLEYKNSEIICPF